MGTQDSFFMLSHLGFSGSSTVRLACGFLPGWLHFLLFTCAEGWHPEASFQIEVCCPGQVFGAGRTGWEH